MNCYLTSIKTAVLVFPLISIVVLIPYIIYQYYKYKSITVYRIIIFYSFILYLLIMYFLIILPLPNIKEVVFKPNMIRIVPFGFVRDFFKETSLVLNNSNTYLKAIKEPCFYTVAFNMVMMIPFGIYLRYYFNCSLKKTVLLTFSLSLFFEITQITGLYFIYPYPYRVFDVDDLMINTLGGIVGYVMFDIE